MAKQPKLSVSTAQSKANAVSARLDALVPNLASNLSPSLSYTSAAVVEVAKNGSALTANDYGWTCPTGVTSVQVECFGAGGGGGGGGVTGVAGGGGGGGGEYACEPNYPVVPGEVYSYFAGLGGVKGFSSQMLANGQVGLPAFDGPATCFDFRGKGISGGVVANGGQGGDQLGVGVSGRGGTGSSNTIHFDGGTGGTSASGNQSDNPILGVASGLANDYFWYRLDDAVGSTVAHDFSSKRVQTSGVVKQSGAIVQPVAGIPSPVQVPFGPSANWWGGSSPGETQGNCWQWAHGSTSGFTGGLRVGAFTYASSIIRFSVSAWVKGDPGAASSGDWQDGTHTASVLVSNRNINTPTAPGFSLFLGKTASGTSTLNLTVVQGNGAAQTVTATGPSAIDGNWHMCTATLNTAGNIILYVDGVAVQTTATSVAGVGGATSIYIGYNGSTNAYGYKGYMSNTYFTAVVLSPTYISFAYGASAATGGSGGGASGGSAGTGNNGASAIGTIGGAGGAAAAATQPGVNNGSGAGGAGGNQNAAGNVGVNTIPYAGGGGGAGSTAVAVPSEFQVNLSCSMSGSYTGLDAQGATDGQLYTVSADPLASTANPWYSTAAKQDAICYTGGAADSPFKGSMNSLLTFPSLANVNGNQGAGAVSYLSNNAAWTIQKLYLTLTVQSTNAANLVIGTWNSNTIVSALDSDATLTAWGYSGPLLTANIPVGEAGRQVVIDLSGTAIAASLVSLAQRNNYTINGSALQGCGLLIGTLTGSATYQGNIHGAWNAGEAPDWDCAFYGADAAVPSMSAQLNITYTVASPTLVAAGNGAPGYIVISFINPQGIPVATVLPQSVTDANSNVLGAGFTADAPNYNVWHPGSSPKILETWQAATITLAGWANQGGSNMVLSYRLMPGNMVWVNGIIQNTTGIGGTLFTLPAAYRPAHNQGLFFWNQGAPAGGVQNWHAAVNTDGTVTTGGLGGISNSTWAVNGFISLDG